MVEAFERDQAVVSSRHRKNIFTTAGYDNIDHNPKSTTAKKTFHGIVISITEHPDHNSDGVERYIDLSTKTALTLIHQNSINIIS